LLEVYEFPIINRSSVESLEAESKDFGGSFNWLGAVDTDSNARIIAMAKALPRMGDGHRSRL